MKEEFTVYAKHIARIISVQIKFFEMQAPEAIETVESVG
jgi:hypothetical protein